MRVVTKSILFVFAIFFSSLGFLRIEGFRMNITNSYPQGLYRITESPIQKGSLVIFCPPKNDYSNLALNRGYFEAGFCPGGYSYMIKKIMAAKNDVVRFSNSGVFVNDALLPNSAPKTTDKSGRDLTISKEQKLIITDDSVLLMSDYSPDSFDSRYFGLVDKSNIISSIRPIITW